ncbi:MAG: ribose 5-phosphate isomerase B [Candidatus Omnitrophica bacterium]|nr:ribose 5-phosphate isomerase B [Candidatus Omnitrophota bacterium]
MEIYVGSDHRGYLYKDKIIGILAELGYEAKDCGTYEDGNSCDYPKYAYTVASKVAKKKDSRGVLVCMSGIGQTIAANKVKGAYAALCYNAKSAELSRLHNNANVLVLSAKFVKAKDLKNILKVWLSTSFEGGRHQRRLDMIKKIESGKKL